MYLGGPKRHSVETISAIVSKRGRTPGGKLVRRTNLNATCGASDPPQVATFVDGRLTTAIVDSRRVENDATVINELTEFYAMRCGAKLLSFDRLLTGPAAPACGPSSKVSTLQSRGPPVHQYTGPPSLFAHLRVIHTEWRSTSVRGRSKRGYASVDLAALR